MKIMIFCEDPSYFSQEKILTAPNGTVFEIRETEPEIDLFPKGPYINDVSEIFRILDPLPPCQYQIHATSLPLVINRLPPPPSLY